MMIKNVIFDIGNVLMTFDPYHYYQTVFADKERTKQICQHIFTHEAWLKYDQGILFIKDLYQIYHKEFCEYHLEIDEILSNWMKLMQPITTSFTCMKQLKNEGYHIYILSNISKDSTDYLKATQPFFSWCDGAVLSYEEKLLKPDPLIYKCLFERYDLIEEECLFIDDRLENIKTAKQLGMKGILLDDPQKLANYLEESLEKKVC